MRKWLVVQRWRGEATPIARYFFRASARFHARQANKDEAPDVIYTVERITPSC